MTVASSEQPPGRIVVGIDGSPSSEQALRWAAEQARLSGQEVHAVIAWDVPHTYDEPLAGDFDWRGDAAGVLKKAVENTLGEPDAGRVVQHVTQGHPAKVLLDAARDADLLVVGCRGHGGLTGLLLGSVSQNLIAHAGCPVVIVHDHGTATGRIIVGVDGSPESEQALRWAADQARLTGCELQAINAWHVPAAYGFTVRPEPDWAAHCEQALAASVAGALDEKDAARVVQDVVQDYPAGALLRAAESADLLVVGCRGRGGFPRMLLGSVSRHVAAHAPCPVVVHRSATAAQPGR